MYIIKLKLYNVLKFLYSFIILNKYNNLKFKIIDYSSIKRHMEVLLGLARANAIDPLGDCSVSIYPL